MFLFQRLQKTVVERQVKHDIGYWMTILGAATVVIGGLFGSFLWFDTQLVLFVVIFGVVMFGVGAELALRNQRHEEHFP